MGSSVAAALVSPPPRALPQAAGASLLLLPSFFTDLDVCRAVSSLRFLTPHDAMRHFALFLARFHRGSTVLAEGLSCALRWGHWSWLDVTSPHSGPSSPPTAGADSEAKAPSVVEAAAAGTASGKVLVIPVCVSVCAHVCVCDSLLVSSRSLYGMQRM